MIMFETLKYFELKCMYHELLAIERFWYVKYQNGMNVTVLYLLTTVMGFSVFRKRTVVTSCNSSDVFWKVPPGFTLFLGPSTKTECTSSSCYKKKRLSLYSVHYYIVIRKLIINNSFIVKLKYLLHCFGEYQSLVLCQFLNWIDNGLWRGKQLLN